MRTTVTALVFLVSAFCLGAAHAAQGIHIDSATYGQNCGTQYGNATWSVRQECEGRWQCGYQISVNKIGDPAYGCSKDFRVEYTCPNGYRQTAYAYPEANTQSVFLSCGNGGGLHYEWAGQAPGPIHGSPYGYNYCGTENPGACNYSGQMCYINTGYWWDSSRGENWFNIYRCQY